jgi:hypothetical protein
VPGERFSTKRPDTFTQTVASLNFNLLQSGGGPYIINRGWTCLDLCGRKDEYSLRSLCLSKRLCYFL